MVFSTIIYIASKQKAVVHVDNNDDKLVEEEVLSHYEEESSDEQENLCKLEKVITEAKEKGQEEDDAHAPSPDLLSESESEVDYSDGSISDEESLIEIALTSGHNVDPQKYDSNYNYKCDLEKKTKRELSGEALFSQQSLMEFLSEFNEVSEEENLIEIDISMGSIKYSRFEIKA